MYDRLAVKYIEPGVTLYGRYAVHQSPTHEDITLDKLVLVDINTQRVMKIQVNIIYETQLHYHWIISYSRIIQIHSIQVHQLSSRFHKPVT